MKEIDDKHRNNRGDGGTDNWNMILKENPFTVPDGYFADLEAVTRFRAAQVTLTNHNFPVPADYFETLEQQITARIATENLKALVPAEGYASPDSYFKDLESRILARTVGQAEPAVVVPLRKQRTGTAGRPAMRRLFRPSWVKYATAACLLLVSSLLITNRLNTDTNTYNLSGIPDQELINYLQVFSGTQDALMLSEYATDFEQIDLHSDISSDEIEWYLANTL